MIPTIRSLSNYIKSKKIKSCIHFSTKFRLNYQEALKFYRNKYYSISFHQSKKQKNLEILSRKKLEKSKSEERSKKKKRGKKMNLNLSGVLEEEMNMSKLGYADNRDLYIILYDEAILKNSTTVVDDAIISYKTLLYPKIKEKIKEILASFNKNDKELISNITDKGNGFSEYKNWMMNAVNEVLNNIQLYLSQKSFDIFFNILLKLEKCNKREKFKNILFKIFKNMSNILMNLNVVIKTKINLSNNSKLLNTNTSSSDNIIGEFNVNDKKERKPCEIKEAKENNKDNDAESKNQSKKEIKRIKKNELLEFESENLNNTNNNKIKIIPISKVKKNLFKTSTKNLVCELEKNELNFKSLAEDLKPFKKLFKEAIANEDKEEILEILYEFQGKIIDKYGFTKMKSIIQQWTVDLEKNKSLEGLNLRYEDLEDLFTNMQNQLGFKEQSNELNDFDSFAVRNSIVISDIQNNNEGDEYFDDSIDIKKYEEALLKDLKQFNIGNFFQSNYGLNLKKHENFKQQLELLTKDLNSNSKIKVNENDMFAVRQSQHIKLSQKFRNRKNKFIDYGYPFKEEMPHKYCSVL